MLEHLIDLPHCTNSASSFTRGRAESVHAVALFHCGNIYSNEGVCSANLILNLTLRGVAYQ